MSLRKQINEKCKDCIYDPDSIGTWRQQVTLCSTKTCALYDVRPKTAYPIPEAVYSYYGINVGQYQDLIKQ